MIDDVLITLQRMIANITGTSPVIGALPPLGGYAINYVGGAPIETYRQLDKNVRLPVLFNGKAESQELLCSKMHCVHSVLTTSKTLPYGNGWQMYAIVSTSLPNPIGREESKNWIYGSSFDVYLYLKGVNNG